MPILNLNTTNPRSKNARKDARPIRGNVFSSGLASAQHTRTVLSGNTYAGSTSGRAPVSVFPQGPLNATQPQLPALKMESPGRVVPLVDFVRVHPNEKGTVLGKRVVPVVSRVGGPSKHHDTATNPNVRKVATTRPARQPNVTTERVHTTSGQVPVMSFLRGGGTLRTHPHADQYQSRWSQTKRGAAF